MKKIIFLVTVDWFFVMHRLPLARAAKAEGYDVYIATRIVDGEETLRQAGLKVIPMSWKRRARGPLASLLAIIEIRRLYRNYKPDLVHQISVKSILLGSIASWSLPRTSRPVVINNFTGLGTLFVNEGSKSSRLRNLVRQFGRQLFRSIESCQLFENHDDQAEFYANDRSKRNFAKTILSVGVNTQEFDLCADFPQQPVVLLASRLIWPKGLGVLVEAHQLLQKRGIKLRLVVIGKPDLHNADAISQQQLDQWEAQRLIEQWGFRSNMADCYKQASVVCLPTWYREGVPRSLLEAASCGKPTIATDMPGCREVVVHGETGLLVQPHDSAQLAEAIESLVCNPQLCRQMGLKARQRVERKFSEEKVVKETLELYSELTELNKREPVLCAR